MITSSQNSKIKKALHLYKRRDRDRTSSFLIEGFRELSKALNSDWEVETLFFSPSHFLGGHEEELIQGFKQKGTQVIPTSEKIFTSLSFRDRPDGLLGIGKSKELPINGLIWNSKNPLFVIAEAIEKPGNLGTILRSCDAVKADGVIICNKCTDLFNPNVVRASIGALFTVPLAEANNETTYDWLKKNNILIVATTPSASAIYYEAHFQGPTAIIVGTEQYGLSSFWLEKADLQVRIPMLGKADSLNVATATTLLLYEVLRQKTCNT